MKTALLSIMVLTALTLTACSSVNDKNTESTSSQSVTSQTGTSEADTDIPSNVTSAIMAEINIPSATQKDIDSLGLYYDIDVDMISSMSLFICGSGAYPDELAVFELKDSKNADTVKKLVQKRLDSQIALYRDYTPNEMYKLDGAVLKSKGNYVYLLVCENNDRAGEITDKLI